MEGQMRTLRERNVDTKAARMRLPVQPKPYWRLVEPNLHLGYRRLKKRPGSWIRRRYLGNEEYRHEWIGHADDYGPADGQTILTFQQAQERCRGRPAAKAGPYTVRSALEDYFTRLEADGKSASARDLRKRAETSIPPELLDRKADALTAGEINAWRTNLATQPPRARTGKNQRQNYRKFDSSDPEDVRQRQSTVNRQWTILRAALNNGFRNGKISSDAEWRRVKPFKSVDKARADYLETAVAKRLINACTPDFRLLVHGALQTGCRLSELARLTAGDFHVAKRRNEQGKQEEIGTVTVRRSKSGKARHVVLTDEGIQLFKRLTAGRSNGDLIFQNNGLPWTATQRPMADACKQAGIKPAVSFHILRHTWASLAVMNGVPLLVVAKNLGHADTRMVEKHYGHLSQSYVNDAIRAGAPRFGVEPDNVAAIR
jgi:integrase